MPQVTAQGKTFSCPVGANLRQVLLENRVDLYNGQARLMNSRGIGTCGTCAVAITGEVSAANRRDRIRHSYRPMIRNGICDWPARPKCWAILPSQNLMDFGGKECRIVEGQLMHDHAYSDWLYER